MHTLRSLTRAFLTIILLTTVVIPRPPVYAQEECTEADYRDLGVLVLQCNGTTGQPCTASHGSAEMSVRIPEPHRSILSTAASAYSVNPNLLAALYLTEQGNVWRPLEGPYATNEESGAAGPFQFMPATWTAYGTDGNNDGVIDIQNYEDAAFAAAAFAASGTTSATPLGNIARPFNPDTMIYFAASYNWGIGNIMSKTEETSPLSAGPEETANYVNNLYSLFTSDFTTSGNPAHGDPRLPDGTPTGSTAETTACGSSSAGLVTTDPNVAREIVLSSENIRWGNYGPESSQKDDVRNCLSNETLVAFATMAERSGASVPINAIASDHGGCNAETGSHHNVGRAIDIGYYGRGADGDDRHTDEGDVLYRFLFNNREELQINQLIWQYPEPGYNCMNRGVPGDCDVIYSEATIDNHYHHIHVSFGGL
jgi:hypothetical protein